MPLLGTQVTISNLAIFILADNPLKSICRFLVYTVIGLFPFERSPRHCHLHQVHLPIYWSNVQSTTDWSFCSWESGNCITKFNKASKTKTDVQLGHSCSNYLAIWCVYQLAACFAAKRSLLTILMQSNESLMLVRTGHIVHWHHAVMSLQTCGVTLWYAV